MVGSEDFDNKAVSIIVFSDMGRSLFWETPKFIVINLNVFNEKFFFLV